MTLDVYRGLFTDELDAVAERMHTAATNARASAAGAVTSLQAMTSCCVRPSRP